MLIRVTTNKVVKQQLYHADSTVEVTAFGFVLVFVSVRLMYGYTPCLSYKRLKWLYTQLAD
jgi:hypothetical protein